MAESFVKRKSPIALLLVDVVNHFEFEDGSKILPHALAIAPNLARLRKRARKAGVPVIYVNDNFGQWRSDARKLLAHCLRPDCAGKPFVEAIRPDEDDYCVLKPMHSAFYQTPLEALLRHLGTHELVLAGIATNSCVLCTAHDAKVREFKITVVSDCCAARSNGEHKRALDHIRDMTDARVITLASLSFARPRNAGGGHAR